MAWGIEPRLSMGRTVAVPAGNRAAPTPVWHDHVAWGTIRAHGHRPMAGWSGDLRHGRDEMATDYDAPRKTDDEMSEDSLEELKARRVDKSASSVDVDGGGALVDPARLQLLEGVLGHLVVGLARRVVVGRHLIPSVAEVSAPAGHRTMSVRADCAPCDVVVPHRGRRSAVTRRYGYGAAHGESRLDPPRHRRPRGPRGPACLLYTSDAADE